MGFKRVQKVLKLGKASKGLTLPKAWLDYIGDDLDEVTLIGDGVLIIAPKGQEDRARRMMEAYRDDDGRTS